MSNYLCFRLALSPVLACLVVASAFASNTPGSQPSSDKVALPSATAAVPAGLTTLAHIPATADKLGVLAEDAKVSVVQGACDDIVVASNCPMHWNVQGSIIRQAGFVHPRPGCSMKADALGSRAIVNGKVYMLPSGQISGGLKMDKEGVAVGGKKLDALAGTEMPGIAEGEDEVYLLVPASFNGELVLGAGGHSKIAMPAWRGGSVKITMLDGSELAAGPLSDLSKAAIDMHGDGKAEIKGLSTNVFVANITGGGTIAVQQGTARMSNATVSGSGRISMQGHFDNLKQAVSGNGTIEVH